MDKQIVNTLIRDINRMADRDIKIMEVCGTHTQMISKLGLRTLLSPKIKLLSGPGCPVCVTEEGYIDSAIIILRDHSPIMATFGDLMRVKGSEGCLLDEKAKGKDIRVVYSPMDLIESAESNRDRKFVFLGVGFETTAPVIALAIKTAAERDIKNLYFLTSIKLMQPILHYILKQPESQIQGLICPGHVAAVKGADYFNFLGKEYGIPAAVCGFEALDIVGGIHYLVENITQDKKGTFENLYKRCVRPEGNVKAKELMEEVFEISNGVWRGIGSVENSSLIIRGEYSYLDAARVFEVNNEFKKAQGACECREILLGNKAPGECRLFSRVCKPLNPVGPCMVSTEGACAIAYRYREEV